MSTENSGEQRGVDSNVYYLDDYRAEPSSKRSTSPAFGTKEFQELVKQARERLNKAILASQLAKLEKATPVILFQVSYGRNAWHSTWISRYLKGSLLASRNEVYSLVNKRLKQGTSYRMTVMPGWHLEFPNARFLVAEINTSKPFERLSDPAFARVGISKRDALALLDPSSSLWAGRTPKHDSVIVQETRRPASDFRLWSDRTHEPMQPFTAGRYKRKIIDSKWWMFPVASDYDTSQFEAVLEQLED